MGSMASAVLLLNNYRDLAADRPRDDARSRPCSGRRGHSVVYACSCCCHSPCQRGSRCATRRTRRMARVAVLPLLVDLIVEMRRLQGPALNAVLGRTAIAQLVFGSCSRSEC